MADTSNIDEVVRWLGQFVKSFSFDRRGVDRSMGRDLAHLVAGGIADRSAKGLAPDGSKWKPVDDTPRQFRGQVFPGYRTRKRQAYGWPESDGKPGYRTGQMLSHLSLMGDTKVTADTVEMHYGIDAPPGKTYSPIDNRTPSQVKADESVTDREKAGWAEENDRPFYELDDNIREAVLEEAARLLSEYIQREG